MGDSTAKKSWSPWKLILVCRYGTYWWFSDRLNDASLNQRVISSETEIHSNAEGGDHGYHILACSVIRSKGGPLTVAVALLYQGSKSNNKTTPSP